MDCEYPHQPFNSVRVAQSLCNDRCQNILYKAVFEHFIKIKNIAALLLTSKSFQNSSFGANFLVNFVVDDDSISLLATVLSPSSCFSLQFAPSLVIWQTKYDYEEIYQSFSNFVGELVNTKYLHLSLRSLRVGTVTDGIVSCFFGSSSNTWPQLQDLKLASCHLHDRVLKMISEKAVHLRTVSLSVNREITDAGLEHVSRLSRITYLDLSCCNKITDAGLQHLSKLTGITLLDLSFCYLITDVGLEHISKLSGITSLELCGCLMITDAGLEHLSTLSSIASLNLGLRETITIEAKKKFKSALPNCTFYV